jgi:hypothetical protein
MMGRNVGSTEETMSTTMHNKIYLGRNTLLTSHRMQAVLALSALAGAGLVWAVVRTFR